jgi:hypothetical protein
MTDFELAELAIAEPQLHELLLRWSSQLQRLYADLENLRQARDSKSLDELNAAADECIAAGRSALQRALALAVAVSNAAELISAHSSLVAQHLQQLQGLAPAEGERQSATPDVGPLQRWVH